MSKTVICPCGTTLRAPDSAAGKLVSCPKCNTKVRVPDAEPATAPAPVANDSILMTCVCGAAMKVAAEHVGKAVACPKCGNQAIVQANAPVMGGQATATPLQQPATSVAPAPADDLFDDLPDSFGGTGDGLSTAPPVPAYRKAPKKKRKPGVSSPAGTLVAAIGVSIIAAGLASCCVGLASLHYMMWKAVSQKEALESRFSPSAMQAEFNSTNPAERFAKMRERQRELAEERAAFFKRRKMFENTFKYGMKIGRVVMAAGCLVAVVGYGISIGTGGAQMGLAIAAFVIGLLGLGFEVVLRVVPWLKESGVPTDIFLMRVGPFGFSEGKTLGMAGIEVLMAGHLILFAIYALLGYVGRRNREGMGFAIASISTAGVYLLMVLVLSIMISDPSQSKSFMYTLFGVYWTANAVGIAAMACWLVPCLNCVPSRLCANQINICRVVDILGLVELLRNARCEWPLLIANDTLRWVVGTGPIVIASVSA